MQQEEIVCLSRDIWLRNRALHHRCDNCNHSVAIAPIHGLCSKKQTRKDDDEQEEDDEDENIPLFVTGSKFMD